VHCETGAAGPVIRLGNDGHGSVVTDADGPTIA
jgi:hypothetical protein